LITKLTITHIDRYILDRRRYCDIEVFIKDKKYNLNSLIDTGTFLYDDNSKSHIIIAEKSIFKNDDIDYVIPISFRSLGCEEGYIYGIRGEKAIINNKTLKPVIIGLYDGKLSDGSFDSIISPEIIGGI